MIMDKFDAKIEGVSELAPSDYPAADVLYVAEDLTAVVPDGGDCVFLGEDLEIGGKAFRRLDSWWARWLFVRRQHLPGWPEIAKWIEVHHGAKALAWVTAYKERRFPPEWSVPFGVNPR